MTVPKSDFSKHLDISASCCTIMQYIFFVGDKEESDNDGEARPEY
jgi:hypothetical protein